MCHGRAVVSGKHYVLAVNVETNAVCDAGNHAHIIIGHVFFANTELNGHAVGFDSRNVERHIVQCAGNIFSDTQSHDSGILFGAIFICAVGVFYKAVGGVIRAA